MNHGRGEGMTALRRGRPPQSEAEKLQPVTINLRPADFDAACALAKAQREPVAVVLREMVLSGLQHVECRG